MLPLEHFVPGATDCQATCPLLQIPNLSVPLQTMAPLEEQLELPELSGVEAAGVAPGVLTAPPGVFTTTGVLLALAAGVVCVYTVARVDFVGVVAAAEDAPGAMTAGLLPEAPEPSDEPLPALP